MVIDQDLGHSGTSMADRLGFQWLVAEVGLGRVGPFLSLEVSRLARSCSDWYHLLGNLCAHRHAGHRRRGPSTIPALYNDRLLLGLYVRYH